MLTAAALVPDTALLVPGAAGRSADPLAELREAALTAVARVLGSGARRLVVVAPGTRTRTFDEPLRASLAAAGVPDALLAWPVPGPAGARVPSVPSAVALHLLARVARARAAHDADPGAGHGAGQETEQVQVVEVAPDEPVERLHDLGAALVSDVPTGCVVVGSLSARHGPDAPVADDARAPAFDAALLADLADAGAEARGHLGAVTAQEAGALAVTGWAPWQVLLGMVGGAGVRGELLGSSAPSGAAHAVALWTPVGSDATVTTGAAAAALAGGTA